jgi:putative endonuclease
MALSWAMSRLFYVYIMTNPRHTVLYTGVTNDLARRVWQHREKQIKARSRVHKIELIERMNPEWKDLYDDP